MTFVSNKSLFNLFLGQFSGTVYDPIMMGIDVHDAPANAKYLENTIAARDLVAFAAENNEDVNQLTRQFRFRFCEK